MLANVISETFFPRLIASALERVRVIVCSSLATSPAVTPPSGNSHAESVARMSNGLVQMAFWSPGMFRNIFLNDIPFALSSCFKDSVLLSPDEEACFGDVLAVVAGQ